MARKHKIQKALTHLVQAIIRFAQKLTSRDTYRFLRTAFVTSRRRLQAGFVLPTTTLLILVMMLVVSTLIFRSYQRSTDAITQFQRQEVINSATPAIDRAKAKLELLFDERNAADVGETILEEDLLGDAYTFPGETRIELPAGPGNAKRTIAWKYESDTNGDEKKENDTTTVYTIVLRTTTGTEENPLETMDPALPGGTFITDAQKKADRLLVRNGPLLEGLDPNQSDPKACPKGEQDEENPAAFGWFPKGAIFKKNFQVYALSVPNSVVNGEGTANRSIATVQYQQDRTFEGLNKWGAWFRSDLELTPGFDFNWNGAIHSEGNLFIKPEKTPPNPPRKVQLYLISSENSCFYKPESNSEVSTWGHLVYGAIAGDNGDGIFNLDIYSDPPTSQLVNATTDSINQVMITNFLNIALDPIKLLTNNTSVPRDGNINALDEGQDAAWEGENNLLNTRVNIGKVSPPPYVDDTYRADNLYGPKPGYEPPEIQENENGRATYSVEPTQNMGSALSDPELTRDEPPSVLKPDDYGLDGYWERRARGQGLRVIVGERLELGNAFGWKQDPNPATNPDKVDPLYPQRPTFVTPAPKGAHEFRQQRTLRDNLAAVQATAVYLKGGVGDGKTPAAIVATTVHPGTADTLKNSATFETISFAKKARTEFSKLPADVIVTDFFNGWGTNGWEFEVPTAPNSKALTNLANFAGDSDGAFPPKQDGKVHPAPFLTMWGNFSSLLRNNGSLADNTTQQTAAATLGMLAYNINYLQSYDYTNIAVNRPKLQALDDELKKLHDNDNANGEIRLNGTNIEIYRSGTPTPIAIEPAIAPAGTFTAGDPTVLPPHVYISLLPETDQKQLLARLLHTKEQVERDRTFGFKRTPATANTTQYTPSFLASAGFTYGGKKYQNGTAINIGCNFSDTANIGNKFFGFGTPTDQATEERFIRLSQLFCSPEPKFPSLYYIFPKFNHDLDGGLDGGLDHNQPTTEPYIAENQTRNYTALNDNDIYLMAIKPKSVDEWDLPNTSVTNATAAPNDNRMELVKSIAANGTANIQVAIKDSALYNGREHMNVRALNLDLNMLKKSGTNWLSNSGIIYAFREDAVREDAIARPGAAYNPNAQTGLPSVMNAVGNAPTDPKLTDKGISLKPVDYYPDPDRRPYGFRLKNGSDISRTGTRRGLTIVSDQPIYIQGNFNLHGKDNGTQEFTDINKTFYERNSLNTAFARANSDTWRPTEVIADAITILSENFCDGSIEDGIIFSHQETPNILNITNPPNPNFNPYGCPGVTVTSYLNQNRPRSGATWKRENGQNTGAAVRSTYPVAISRNGELLTTGPAPASTTVPYTGSYYRFDNFPWGGKPLNKTPANTWVNAVLVNGVVPSRQNQSNGGLHNFPRMLEDWGSTNLNILGSFIQLNFSNYATGPYEHDAWEPGATPVAGKTPQSAYNGPTSGGLENIFYYLAPRRLWGYDVGLQYMPPGAASSKMQELSDERNEFYREPPANDPYICLLRATKEVNFPCN
ncbi:hormogonium polysaccharide biosynthesis protein HpsA [Laspinema olomoucense]|uniref:hormogonium polysaccharide biosynthesis protein HpsA n=1 Tax=Laspinema olomoucense TaxID=3231600 RepID=UPI0021BA5CED|nr:hormogonium polysaccharide biosynthesis protein HpsA [Laspinema sp. D3c]MCT7993930.1 hormogonium polysaccharide biosynthesis protein HpsA [Laspinema sp. D3c]